MKSTSLSAEVSIPVSANGKRSLTNFPGGSAGCVVAGRLAALDRNLTVLLIEGGENNLNNPWVYRYPRPFSLW